MVHNKPVIGIVLDLPKPCEENKYSKFPWYALRINYSEAVSKAGGIPIFLSYDYDSLNTIIDLIDGLLIPGGDNDIHPNLYGQQIQSDLVTINEPRTNFELAIFKQARAKNIPFLGICGGMQLLNVAMGGTLIQHIPDIIKSDILHQQQPPMNISTHKIKLIKDTLLHNLCGDQDQIMVNSNHHQAIELLGNDLIVSAKAEDGIIEAIENPKCAFMVGVEWHPEYLNEKIDLYLFQEFIKASSIYRSK